MLSFGLKNVCGFFSNHKVLVLTVWRVSSKELGKVYLGCLLIQPVVSLTWSVSHLMASEGENRSFLRRGRQPEVNISHARTVFSPRFLN